ncbi:MAG TPA: hypothetical protein VLC98_09530 [Phnomibacter sp.]|nr:hypothetical protein [Phnomibacter sp.]
MQFIINKVKTGFLLKSFFSGGTSSLLKLLSGLILVKGIAIIGGPEGMAVSGTFLNVAQLAQTFATAGISLGVIRYISSNIGVDTTAYKLYLGNSIGLTLIFSTSCALMIIGSSPWLALAVFGTMGQFYYFIILGIGAFFYGMNNFLFTYYSAHQLHRQYLFFNIINSSAGMLFTLAMLFFFGMRGAFVSIALHQSIGFLLYGFNRVFVLWQNELKKQFQLQWGASKKLLSYSIYLLENIVIISVVQLLTRSLLIAHHGADTAGLWDGMSRISSSYITASISIILIYFIPRFSKGSLGQCKQILLKQGAIFIGIIGASFLTLYVFRGPVVGILFSEAFGPVEKLFPYFLIGDLCRIFGYLITTIFISRKNLTVAIVSDIIFNALLLYCMQYLLIPQGGLTGVGEAYLFTYVAYMLVMMFYFLVSSKNALKQMDAS